MVAPAPARARPPARLLSTPTGVYSSLSLSLSLSLCLSLSLLWPVWESEKSSTPAWPPARDHRWRYWRGWAWARAAAGGHWPAVGKDHWERRGGRASHLGKVSAGKEKVEPHQGSCFLAGCVWLAGREPACLGQQKWAGTARQRHKRTFKYKPGEGERGDQSSADGFAPGPPARSMCYLRYFRTTRNLSKVVKCQEVSHFD